MHCCSKIPSSKWATIMNCAFVMPVVNSQHQPRTISLSRPSQLSVGATTAFYLWPDSSAFWTLGPEYAPWTFCRRKFDLWCPCFQDNFLLPFLTCPDLVIQQPLSTALVFIARKPVKWFGQRLLQYDFYLTDKETESLSLRHYSWVAVQGLNPSTSAPHHHLNSLPTRMDKRPTQCWKQELTWL